MVTWFRPFNMHEFTKKDADIYEMTIVWWELKYKIKCTQISFWESDFGVKTKKKWWFSQENWKTNKQTKIQNTIKWSPYQNDSA